MESGSEARTKAAAALALLFRAFLAASGGLALFVLVAPAPLRLKVVVSVMAAVHSAQPAPSSRLAVFPPRDGAPDAAVLGTVERSFYPDHKNSLVAGDDWGSGAARIEDDGLLASSSVSAPPLPPTGDAPLPAGLVPENLSKPEGTPASSAAALAPILRPAEPAPGVAGGRRLAAQPNRLGLIGQAGPAHADAEAVDVDAALRKTLEANVPERARADSGGGQAPGGPATRASQGGGAGGQAGDGGLGALRAGLGREADAIRRDLALPGLKTVHAWAAAGWPRLASAAAQLRHIRSDVTIAGNPLHYDSPAARVEQSLKRLGGALDHGEYGLITVVEGASAGSKTSAGCLNELAESELVRSTQSVTCHRALSLALRGAHRLEPQVRELNSEVAGEYFRIRGALPNGGAASQEDSHLSKWIGDWILARHVPELLKTLDAKVEREAARRLSARAKTRVEEWNKALAPYYETLKSGSGGLKALAAINETQLHLAMSERFYADVARGEAGPAGLSDGSERAVLAYYSAMKAWRDLVEFEERRKLREQQKGKGPR